RGSAVAACGRPGHRAVDGDAAAARGGGERCARRADLFVAHIRRHHLSRGARSDGGVERRTAGVSYFDAPATSRVERRGTSDRSGDAGGRGDRAPAGPPRALMWSNVTGGAGGAVVAGARPHGKPHQNRALWTNRSLTMSLDQTSTPAAPLDGNAAAGPLREVFVFDATSATVTCGGCGATAQVGS